MYALYDREDTSQGTRYRFSEQISLFGCNSGYIPWLLTKQLRGQPSEPLPWHINVASALEAVDQAGQTLIINLKPRSKEPNLSLYEVADVWGYSRAGWTPIMFHLRGLFIDQDPRCFDERDFTRSPSDVDDPIFSMMYLHGTVRDGQLEGRWTTPGPSPTNSVLLWPDTLIYFTDAAKRIMEQTA